MAAIKKGKSIESLLESEEWEKARKRIERELERDADNHWLLAQLGVTYYEQQRYSDALQPLASSLEIVPDCPLTLWNLAGTFDALDKPREALAIYTWLLRSKKTPDDDSCWESREWTDSLKTDCVYRTGVCFQRLGKWEAAEHVFQQYIRLILEGMNGTYSIADATRQLRKQPIKKLIKKLQDVQAVFDSALRDPAFREVKFERGMPPKFTRDEILAG